MYIITCRQKKIHTRIMTIKFGFLPRNLICMASYFS